MVFVSAWVTMRSPALCKIGDQGGVGFEASSILAARTPLATALTLPLKAVMITRFVHTEFVSPHDDAAISVVRHSSSYLFRPLSGDPVVFKDAS